VKTIFPITLLSALAVISPVRGQGDFFELSPIKYSETPASDPMAKLAAAWESGALHLPANDSRAVLQAVLDHLEIPSESQGLVFSKTSKQNDLINPRNPRAVYFGDNAYVGYVPGGNIEVAAFDPVLGPVFYLLDRRKFGTKNWVTRDNSCLQCHGTSRTELVPGVLVRSVFADKDGQALLGEGTFVTDHASPFKERWGGWLVTGTHGDFRHMGNGLATEKGGGRASFDYEAGANWESLEGRIDTSKYLQPTSDIVALMVLEHQCKMHNLLTKAAMEYRRLAFLQKAIDAGADLAAKDGMAARSAADSVEEILRYLLFCDELDLGDGVESEGMFAEAFEALGPASAKGNSLRELRLYGRLFKHRCSYMIYSHSFESLPEAIRSRVLERLWEVMSGKDDNEEFSHLGRSEKSRIVEIVKETMDRLPACWK
jgi:hypothetical protein